ncbi:MAG: Flp family type IVb pilin [Syntrophobacter sp.]
MKEMLTKFIKDEEGVTMIEYALIAALIAVVCITALTSLGTSIEALWGKIEAGVNATGSGSGSGSGT